MRCLTWQWRGTPIVEEKIYEYSSTTLSTYFYSVERSVMDTLDVATIFRSFWEWITKKTNFPIWEMTFVHYLAEIKEIALGGTSSGILYNFLFKVIITLRGLESYTTWHFYKYGWPKITIKTSRGETSHNTSSLKFLMSSDRKHCWLTRMLLPWRRNSMV